MPEPEPVREPAPPPPRECRRRRRLSGSSASSRACRAQRRLHLGMGGGPRRGGSGGGGGGAYPLAATESWACRVPRPRAGGVVGTRGARLGATPPHPLQATAPPMEQWRSGGRDPAPCSARGEGARGRGPSALIGSQQGCPTHGLGRIPPRSASAGYCYNPGFPGATRMGRDSEHLTPPSTLAGNAQPLTLDPWRFQVLES